MRIACAALAADAVGIDPDDVLAVGPFHELDVGAGDAVEPGVEQLAEAAVGIALEHQVEAVVDAEAVGERDRAGEQSDIFAALASGTPAASSESVRSAPTWPVKRCAPGSAGGADWRGCGGALTGRGSPGRPALARRRRGSRRDGEGVPAAAAMATLPGGNEDDHAHAPAARSSELQNPPVAVNAPGNNCTAACPQGKGSARFRAYCPARVGRASSPVVGLATGRAFAVPVRDRSGTDNCRRGHGGTCERAGRLIPLAAGAVSGDRGQRILLVGRLAAWASGGPSCAFGAEAGGWPCSGCPRDLAALGALCSAVPRTVCACAGADGGT